ncbi:MAG: NAD-dependent epimerase/dehydratase family protein, partial [Chloroflexi bacterium]|nr:NAD-dependent epimerase/dehydratase family protein [Chloroflexota bacterium]
MAQINVLITGSSGLIGGAVWKRLAEHPDRYKLSGFDIAPDPSKSPTHVGNVADFDAVARAIKGQHTVVHLGANGGPGDLWDRIRESNLIGTYNVFEASRRAGVRRIIFASTGQVTWNWEQEPPLSDVILGKLEPPPLVRRGCGGGGAQPLTRDRLGQPDPPPPNPRPPRRGGSRSSNSPDRSHVAGPTVGPLRGVKGL